jgi:glycosyltransferase Alg8
LVHALLLLTARPRLNGLYPPLIYFSQVYGALIKTYVTFRLDRRRWPRQDMGIDLPPAPARPRLQRLAPTYLNLLALGALVTAVAFATDLLTLPQPGVAGGPF